MSKNGTRIIPVVNKNNKIIGYKDRDHLDKNDIYRVSALWVTNSRGEILLARRHRNKLQHPRKWNPAACGTVDKGETYRKNIIKEAEEELGLKNIKPKLGPMIEINNDYHHFTQWYFLKVDKNINEFIIEEDATEEVKWFSLKELKKDLKEHPEDFIPDMEKHLKRFQQK